MVAVAEALVRPSSPCWSCGAMAAVADVGVELSMAVAMAMAFGSRVAGPMGCTVTLTSGTWPSANPVGSVESVAKAEGVSVSPPVAGGAADVVVSTCESSLVADHEEGELVGGAAGVAGAAVGVASPPASENMTDVVPSPVIHSVVDVAQVKRLVVHEAATVVASSAALPTVPTVLVSVVVFPTCAGCSVPRTLV